MRAGANLQSTEQIFNYRSATVTMRTSQVLTICLLAFLALAAAAVSADVTSSGILTSPVSCGLSMSRLSVWKLADTHTVSLLGLAARLTLPSRYIHRDQAHLRSVVQCVWGRACLLCTIADASKRVAVATLSLCLYLCARRCSQPFILCCVHRAVCKQSTREICQAYCGQL